MRVYLAATVEHLASLADDGQSAGPWEGFAATAALRATLTEVADEDLEFALSVAAGEASAAMAADGRRLVVVADLDEGSVAPEAASPGAVVVRGEVRLDQVDAVLAGERGDDAADSFSWYARQEIRQLVVSH